MLPKITDQEAEEAIAKILLWLGEDTQREGLLETPQRVIASFKEHFAGYSVDISKLLSTKFNEIGEYEDNMILLNNIKVDSFCEHHLAPITGYACVAYIPSQNNVIGISKIARLVEAFSKRLQIQERLTAEILTSINTYLQPKGAAGAILARHHCISKRGVKDRDSLMLTRKMSGTMMADSNERHEFITSYQKMYDLF